MGRRHKRYRLSHTFILVVALVIFGMGIGYAAISTTLNIDGTSDIDSASWDVHFANIQVTTGSVTATTPTITDNTSVSFSANLANPGDFYEFTVDVVNAGTLDAKLDGIEILPVLTQAQSNYFKYTVTYEDGIDINTNDSLAAGVTEKLLIRCEYLKQTDTSLYPTDDTTFNFSVSMTYVQGHGNTRERIIFHTNGTSFTLGQSVPTGVTTYSNPQDAMTAFGYPFFLKQRVSSNNIITESYVGFVLNGKQYYLRSGIDELNLTPQPVYESNVSILQEAFGSSNCSLFGDTGSKKYSCSDSDSEITAYAINYGSVNAYDIDGYGCNSYNNTYCGFYD